MDINDTASKLAFEYMKRDDAKMSPSEFLEKYKEIHSEFIALLNEEPKSNKTVWDIM